VEDIKDETVEEVIDEPIDEPIEEEAEALDITPKKKEEPKKKAAPKKKAPKQSLDRVSITFDDSGDLSVQVDDKNVELLDKEIDALQSGIAFDKENDDESKIKKASLDILKRVDAPAKDEPQIDEPTEEGALDITPKETLPKLRKRAQGLGIENVKKKNTKTLLSEIAALEESKKVEERVEAHDRAAHPEIFEDEDIVAEEDEVYNGILKMLTKGAKEPIEDINERHADDDNWTSESSQKIIDGWAEQLREFKDDPIAYLEKTIAKSEKGLKMGIYSDPTFVKESLAGEKALLEKLKAQQQKPPVQKTPVTKPAAKKADEVHQKMPKKKTYEVTTRGDARFSAFNAILSDG
jgi:hypothetical protein